MNRKYIKIGAVAIVVLGFATLIVYQFTGGSDFSSDMGALKKQFNTDKGKVRLLELLSPT